MAFINSSCICSIVVSSIVKVLLKDSVEVTSIDIELSLGLIQLDALPVKAIGIACGKVTG